MQRHVVCFEIPAFEIAVARLQDASLRGRPVAVAALQRPRATLHDLSLEAQHEGLASGMPVEQARRLCPGLRLIASDPLRIRLAEQQLTAAVSRIAPIWEPVAPGHLFLDLTGTGRLFGPAADTAARLEQEVSRRYGLTGLMGVASNKLVSQAAASVVQPSQLCDVLPGSEPVFMAPLPVSALSPRSHATGVVWPRLLRLLEDLNLRTLGEIADIPACHLERVCGTYGRVLHDRACGIDPSPVFAPVQRPSHQLSAVLDPDEVDDGRLLGVLYGLLESLCRQLRQHRRTCRHLTLTLTYTDHHEISGSGRLPTGSCWEVEMFSVLHALFTRLFRRRVRLCGLTIKAEQLEPFHQQLSLFDATTGGVAGGTTLSRSQRLALALDALRDRFGPSMVRFGRTMASR